MAEFVGMVVNVVVKNGSVFEGKVTSVDKDTQSLSLTDVNVCVGQKQPSRRIHEVVIKAADITDLSVVKETGLNTPPTSSTTSSTKNSTRHAKTADQTSKRSTARKLDFDNSSNNSSSSTLTDIAAKPTPTNTNKFVPQTPASTTVVPLPLPLPGFDSQQILQPGMGGYISEDRTTPRRGARQQHHHSDASANEEEQNDWQFESVDTFINQDFDFDGNLALFDKARVFAAIRVLDEDQTLPQERLVFNNKRGNHTPVRNLGIHENVLDTPSQPRLAHLTSNLAGTSLGFELRTSSNVRVSTVTIAQTRQLDSIAANETGPSDDQLSENAARGAAQIALEMLDSQNKPHDSQRFVVILVGNHKTGSQGVMVGRHLANHNIKVAVCTITQGSLLQDIFANALRTFAAAGGNFWESISVLRSLKEPIDLVIDAIFSSDTFGSPTAAALAPLIQFANEQTAPVLSLEVPSGLHWNSGEQLIEIGAVHAKSTLCFGLPKAGVLAVAQTSELYLLDIGLPKMAFLRLGLPYDPPFASQYFIKLTL